MPSDKLIPSVSKITKPGSSAPQTGIRSIGPKKTMLHLAIKSYADYRKLHLEPLQGLKGNPLGVRVKY